MKPKQTKTNYQKVRAVYPKASCERLDGGKYALHYIFIVPRGEQGRCAIGAGETPRKAWLDAANNLPQKQERVCVLTLTPKELKHLAALVESDSIGKWYRPPRYWRIAKAVAAKLEAAAKGKA